MGVRNLGLVAVVAVLLTGCGASTTVNGPDAAKGVPSVSSDGLRGAGICPNPPQHLPTVRMPSSFVVTAAYECAADTVTVPGRGVWFVKDERRATQGLSALVAALRRPDQPMPQYIACAADAVAVAPFVLVGRDGRIIQPRIPRNECGQPQKAAMVALNSLHWTLLHRWMIKQVETPAEQTSGCASNFKDLFDLYASQLTPGRGTPLDSSPSLIACAYRDTDPALNHPDRGTDTGSNIEIGTFTGWARLHGTVAAALLDGLAGPRRITTCARKHSGFIVVSAAANASDYALIELGGCGRVLHVGVTPSGKHAGQVALQIGQATRAALTLLARLTEVGTV